MFVISLEILKLLEIVRLHSYSTGVVNEEFESKKYPTLPWAQLHSVGS